MVGDFRIMTFYVKLFTYVEEANATDILMYRIIIIKKVIYVYMSNFSLK